MKLTLTRSAIAGLMLIGVAGMAFAAAPAAPAAPPAGSPGTVAPVAKTVFDNVATAATPKLTLTSTSITASQTIKDDYSQNGANKSPQLTWTAGPATTKAYVVVAQDTTTTGANPVQHWIMINVPATVTTLPEGVALGVNPAGNLAGALQATAGGNAGYRGPKPPAGTTHSYVFQVFVVDAPLAGLDTMVTAPTLITALTGHVVAAGSLIAPYTGK